MSLRNKSPKDLIGMFFEALLVLLVAIFLGINSYRFWAWIFPDQQWYLAPLGFSLTGGAAIVYLIIFAWRANTPTKKTIALGMIVFCMIGELVTVGFGFQIEAWTRTGYKPTPQDLDFMKLVIQILGLAHSLAILVYYLGDRIAEMFGDEDGDGVPNYRDRDYRGRTNRDGNANHRPPHSTPATPAPGRRWIAGGEMLIALGLTLEQAMQKWNGVPYSDFSAEVSQRLDISGRNMREIYDQYFSTNGQKAANPR